jgi:hypothetical protein
MTSDFLMIIKSKRIELGNLMQNIFVFDEICANVLGGLAHKYNNKYKYLYV